MFNILWYIRRRYSRYYPGSTCGCYDMPRDLCLSRFEPRYDRGNPCRIKNVDRKAGKKIGDAPRTDDYTGRFLSVRAYQKTRSFL